MNSIELISFLVSGMVWWGYFWFLMSGSNTPSKRRYNQLFIKAVFINHVLFGLSFAMIGVYMLRFTPKNGLWFVPLMTVILIKIGDYISMAINKRHPFFRAKFDNQHKERGNWLDFVIQMCIFMAPVGICALVSQF